MQIRGEQLGQHLARGLKRIYTLHGDEPLLVQEAADAVRAAARAAGHAERQVHTVAGAYFDWSRLLGAAQAMSLFAEKQLVEIRIPSGKPGKDGSEALQRHCESRSDDVLTLVLLPRLDRMQQQSAWFGALDAAGVSVRIEPVDRQALPQWIARRLAAQDQRVEDGEAGQRALAFFADQVEGNLLAAQQEIAKLGLLHPAGELTFAQIEAAVLDVARHDVFRLGEAALSGNVGRTLRMLDGLQAEGEAAPLVLHTLSADILAVGRVRAALAAGRPMPVALREARVWGARERLVERAAARLDDRAVGVLVEAAQVCDGLVKGLKHPAWPQDPWQGLRRLALLMLEHTAGRPPGRMPLAL